MSNILMSKEIKDEILVDEYDIGRIKLLGVRNSELEKE